MRYTNPRLLYFTTYLMSDFRDIASEMAVTNPSLIQRVCLRIDPMVSLRCHSHAGLSMVTAVHACFCSAKAKNC